MKGLLAFVEKFHLRATLDRFRGRSIVSQRTLFEGRGSQSLVGESLLHLCSRKGLDRLIVYMLSQGGNPLLPDRIPTSVERSSSSRHPSHASSGSEDTPSGCSARTPFHYSIAAGHAAVSRAIFHHISSSSSSSLSSSSMSFSSASTDSANGWLDISRKLSSSKDGFDELSVEEKRELLMERQRQRHRQRERIKVTKAVDMIAFCMRRFKTHWKREKSGEKGKDRLAGGKQSRGDSPAWR